MARWLDAVLNALFDELIKDGEKVIDNAARSKEAHTREGNQEDAYGSAVYYNGKVVRRSYYNKSAIASKPQKAWKKHSIPEASGREHLDRFFEQYRPKGKIELVCINAIYTTNILEAGAQSGKGGPNLRAKYRIISQAMTDMEELQRKYKGSTLRYLRAIETNKF